MYVFNLVSKEEIALQQNNIFRCISLLYRKLFSIIRNRIMNTLHDKAVIKVRFSFQINIFIVRERVRSSLDKFTMN